MGKVNISKKHYMDMMEHCKKEHLSRVLNEEYEFRDGLEQTDLDLSMAGKG